MTTKRRVVWRETGESSDEAAAVDAASRVRGLIPGPDDGDGRR